jgi:hypothetical protein
MNHDARCTKLAELFTALHTTTQLTQVTLSTNSTKQASNAKTGSHEFPEFLKQKFRNFGTWKKNGISGNLEIGISGIAITRLNTMRVLTMTIPASTTYVLTRDILLNACINNIAEIINNRLC